MSVLEAIAPPPQASCPPRLPFEQIVLVLQGGGALGAYQGGVYAALAEHGLHPDWVAGISIGAINAALIVGNPPEARAEKLRAFWNAVTRDHLFSGVARSLQMFGHTTPRSVSNQLSAASAMFAGVPGLFSPRWPAPWLSPAGAWEPYDTRPMRLTLERLVDFDRINAGPTRLSVGAVNVRTGRMVYFDTETHRIRAEHIVASAALPPGLPSVEIDGEHYWDGGIVSNSPLQYMAQAGPRRDTLAFQVDLWSGDGEAPLSFDQALVRQKEIQFSSRTRDHSSRFAEEQKLRGLLARLLAKLPPEIQRSAEAQALAHVADRKVASVVHFDYASRAYEGASKDYEFSRTSMEEHWASGYETALRALADPQTLARPDNPEGFAFRDVSTNEGEAA